MRDARDRLQSSQEVIHEQQDQYSRLQQKVQDYEGQIKLLMQQLDATRKDAAEAAADLTSSHHIIKEKDLLIQQYISQLQDKEHTLQGYIEKVYSLERNIAKNPDTDTRVKELEAELQNQESRLLQVNKERLSLVGERASLQAKLASISTQARLLQDDQQEDEAVDQERLSLHVTVASLQEEVQKLERENIELKEEIEKYHEKTDLMKSSQTNTSMYGGLENESFMTRLQEAYTTLQQTYVELQSKSKQQEQQLAALMEKQKVEEASKACLLEQKKLVSQLTAQLESERCLTNNLQLRLDTLRANGSPSASHLEECKYCTVLFLVKGIC